MDFTGPEWRTTAGDWEPTAGILLERSTLSAIPTRYFRNVGLSSYVAQFHVALLSAYGPGGWGEAKFIYTDADRSDNERIDFMVHEHRVRLTVGSFQLNAPLRFGTDQLLQCEVVCSGNSLSLKVNDIVVFDRAPIGGPSSGWIGFGTYEATARFSDFRIEAHAVTGSSREDSAGPRVFISHSAQDAQLAAGLVDLLKSALRLSAQDIRCTSVGGHGLPGGAQINEWIRHEVQTVPVLVGLVSKASMQSSYVLFELGARWGLEKPLIPLLAPGVEPEAMREPLASLNALSISNRQHLQQFVSDVATHLSIRPEGPAVYDRLIEQLVHPGQGGCEVVAADIDLSEDEFPEGEQTIAKHCQEEHPDDFSLQEYCQQQQLKALARLRQGRPPDISEQVFRTIRAKVTREFPNDYSLRLYVEEQQCQAWRNLQNR
ncbi:MAG: toll/interleukin-1 receptor domain-containing protein [Candidatus Eisenbacteria sp.]|nr:toll/interleukin-1 receptor domain-containing protein [Candidatus Eisenbacteria bacterium]